MHQVGSIYKRFSATFHICGAVDKHRIQEWIKICNEHVWNMYVIHCNRPFSSCSCKRTPDIYPGSGSAPTEALDVTRGGPTSDVVKAGVKRLRALVARHKWERVFPLEWRVRVREGLPLSLVLLSLLGTPAPIRPVLVFRRSHSTRIWNICAVNQTAV